MKKISLLICCLNITYNNIIGSDNKNHNMFSMKSIINRPFYNLQMSLINEAQSIISEEDVNNTLEYIKKNLNQNTIIQQIEGLSVKNEESIKEIALQKIALHCIPLSNEKKAYLTHEGLIEFIAKNKNDIPTFSADKIKNTINHLMVFIENFYFV